MARSDDAIAAQVNQEKPRPESRQASELMMSALIIDDEKFDIPKMRKEAKSQLTVHQQAVKQVKKKTIKSSSNK